MPQSTFTNVPRDGFIPHGTEVSPWKEWADNCCHLREGVRTILEIINRVWLDETFIPNFEQPSKECQKSRVVQLVYTGLYSAGRHSPIISADVLSPQPQSRPSSGTQHNNNINITTTMSRVTAISCLLASNLATSLASVAVGLGQINPGENVKFNIHPYREKLLTRC